MWTSNTLGEYELLDASDGERLERWGKYLLIRPDPQIIWKGIRKSPLWKKADARYSRSSTGGGSWDIKKLPDKWNVRVGEFTFLIKPMGFKHTGVFPEQAANWEWSGNLIKNAGRPISVLNLFAYTGGATVACAKAGASVVHVDAAKNMVAQAKTNMALNGLENAHCRYIVDDCEKFVAREIRRGNRYDAIIMDPPSYGRGPGGEVWKLEDNIFSFLTEAVKLMSDDPLFFLINSYTTGLSGSTMAYMLSALSENRGGRVEADELGIKVSSSNMCLPCGASARCVFN